MAKNKKKMSWEDPEFLAQFRAEEARKAARENASPEVKAKREYFNQKSKESKARQTPTRKAQEIKNQAQHHINRKARIKKGE